MNPAADKAVAMIHPLKSLELIQIDQCGLSVNFLDDQEYQMMVILDCLTSNSTSLFGEYDMIKHNQQMVCRDLDQNV